MHVQTPQIFYRQSLQIALDKLKKENLHLSDESKQWSMQIKVLAAPGERSNIKITYFEDLASFRKDLRIGRGIDSHRFQPRWFNSR